MKYLVSGRRQVKSRAMGSSAMALAVLVATPAFAQCAPDPLPADSEAICAGTDGNGLRVTTRNPRIVVGSGATVNGNGSGGAAIDLAPTSDVFSSYAQVVVDGRIDGGGGAGIRLARGGNGNFFTYQSLGMSLTVGVGGTVTGANGVILTASSFNYGDSHATIDNSGMISGTGGIALFAQGANTRFGSINNRDTGVIGAIVGDVGSLINAGTIDGGARSAVASTVTNGNGSYGRVSNSGVIAATSAAATLATGGSLDIANSGSIVNRGTGAAIDGTYVTIINDATGRIATTGATAIRGTTFVSLQNAGTIVGDILTATDPVYSASSRIDNRTGTIAGNVRFGAGDDTLVVRYADGALRTGISGTIDGGAGIDLLQMAFTGDATLGSAFVLPTGFEALGLYLDTGGTVTLARGFAAAGTVRVGTLGGGTVINRANLVATTLAVTNDLGSSSYIAPDFVNAGTIRTTATPLTGFAAAWTNGGRFENGGTIVSTGGGVAMGYDGRSAFVNGGTILAAGTGVSVNGGSFANSGAITSTRGTGVSIEYGSGTAGAIVNTGRIEGAVAGVRLRGTFANDGTITSAGIGVAIDSSATLLNRAGGTITGGTRAVGESSSFQSLYASTVSNAGTINGDVVLRRAFDYVGANRYFAERGGVLNGNLVLGRGDTLVVEMANDGRGLFAGINGTVDGPGANLVYRVRYDTVFDVNSGTFGNIGFDLYDNARLTIASATPGRPLSFAGNGAVDTAIDVTTNAGPIFILTTPTLAVADPAVVQNLSLVSRGTLTFNRTSQSASTAAVVGTTGTRFINAGTIALVDRRGTSGAATAIAGGSEVVNTGTITLDGGVGITNAIDVTNSGRIVQTAGGVAATGLSGVSRLVNSGTIEVAGPAVSLTDYSYSGTRIANSGRIVSTTGPAIVRNDSFGATAIIRNLAGGTIAGGGGTAIRGTGIALYNAGTIDGSVLLGATSGFAFYNQSAYVAAGGTLRGDLRFGGGNDLFVETDGQTGVTGTIDGGAGTDTYRYRRTASGTVTLGSRTATGFEEEAVEAVGVDTLLTVRGDAAVRRLTLFGTGQVVNTIDVLDTVTTEEWQFWQLPVDLNAPGRLTAFTNQATIRNGFYGDVGTFLNSGTIGRAGLAGSAVALSRTGGMAFRNDGTIRNFGRDVAVTLAGDWSIVATNNGMIAGGGLSMTTSGAAAASVADPFALVLNNAGVITSRRPANGDGFGAVTLLAEGNVASGKLLLNNSGTIEAQGASGTAVIASFATREIDGAVRSIEIGNAGTIRANGGGVEQIVDMGDRLALFTDPAAAIAVSGPWSTKATIVNYGSGVIEATGTRSSAIAASGVMLDVTNAGTIRGGAGTVLADDDLLGIAIGTPYLAGAIQGSRGDDRVVNTGTIIGSIALGGGNDRVENYGVIDGNVFLGAGNDTFLHSARATQIGTVDAGEGYDSFLLDATGGGSVNGDQFVNFERFSQIGSGNVTYSGVFRFSTVGVAGGTVTIAAGQTFGTTGATALTGSDAAETVRNDGTIAGSVDLGGGNDRFVNAGLVSGSVVLGAGDDVFVDQPGSRVTGMVDGGIGDDLYSVLLAGDRAGLGSFQGFERLLVDGSGTLTLTQTEAFDRITLVGTGLRLTQQGNRVGLIAGSDLAERVMLDGDVGAAVLGGGDDMLSLGSAIAAGRYDGGAGTDVLRFANAGPVVLSGQATGFETIGLTGGALTVAGTLGSAGNALAFGEGDQSLTIAAGGTLAGLIDLGAGNDSFRLVAGATLGGTVAGGAGTDSALLELAGNRTLAEGVLTGFETLASAGTGVLTLSGTQEYDRIAAGTDLTVAAGGRVIARQVTFGTGDQRLVLDGGFAGSVDGGAGSDGITVSGGSAAAPVAFDTIANVEAFAMSGGYATVSGTAALGNAVLTGGRLVGLAGSTIGAAQIVVGAGATFGSAGTVNGNLTVAGMLSPGASPGTMTVNGNVALTSGSVSLFELTPTVSDRLIVNGAVSIASGTTLQITTTGTIRPGTSFDLIVASGGITGGYTTILKPADLFGYVAQRGDRIQLLGQFRQETGFLPQVTRSIDYANRTLVWQPEGSALGAALPSLLTASGGADARRFAQISPEAYASASQIGIDNALTLAQTTRGPAFATTRETAGAYLFAQGVGQWHTLGTDTAQGTSEAQTRGNGYLGGIGYGDRDSMIGMFAGWMNTRQWVRPLDARTRADGVVVGLVARHGRADGFGFASSIVYDGARARTDRLLPGRIASASGRYDLTSWSADLSVHYAMPAGEGWSLTPRAGATYVRTTRQAVDETGGSAFALGVARDRHLAGFADAGLTFGRSEASDDAFRPFVTLGGRYQFEGTRADAWGGYAAGGAGLLALGAARAPMVATASGGIIYRYAPGFELYAVGSAQTGRDDHQESIITGARLRF